MVESKLIIENKKPIEIVAELKENWWENYEVKNSPLSKSAQGLVNKKSGSDYVSENKEGYGPCYERCGYNNPHCSYQEWMYLRVPCPASDCPDKGQGTVYEWVHATDWGDIKISDCANMKCNDCGTVHHMKDWLFKCPKHVSKHQGDKKYWKVDYDSFTIALNAVFKGEGHKDVMKRLRIHMIEHPEEWD